MRIVTAALCLFMSLPGMALAHEFWIEPGDYTPGANGQITATLVNGQKFKGAKVAFLPQRFRTFTLGLGGNVVDVAGRAGDNPALNMRALGEGLHVAAYQSGLEIVTYEEFAKFAAFVEHKDQADIKDRHLARGLPEAGFSEVYTRYSKSLIGVGTAAGSDRRVGFDIEIVALANPYTDDMSGGLAVQVFYDGAPRANSQVELYEKSRGGAVSIHPGYVQIYVGLGGNFRY